MEEGMGPAASTAHVEEPLYLVQLSNIQPDGRELPSQVPGSLYGDMVGHPLRRYEAEYLLSAIMATSPDGANDYRQPSIESDIPALCCNPTSGRPGGAFRIFFRPTSIPQGERAPGIFVMFGYRETAGSFFPLQRPEEYLPRNWLMPRNMEGMNQDMQRVYLQFQGDGVTRSYLIHTPEKDSFVKPGTPGINGEALLIPIGEGSKIVLGCHRLLEGDRQPEKRATAG